MEPPLPPPLAARTRPTRRAGCLRGSQTSRRQPKGKKGERAASADQRASRGNQHSTRGVRSRERLLFRSRSPLGCVCAALSVGMASAGLTQKGSRNEFLRRAHVFRRLVWGRERGSVSMSSVEKPEESGGWLSHWAGDALVLRCRTVGWSGLRDTDRQGSRRRVAWRQMRCRSSLSVDPWI